MVIQNYARWLMAAILDLVQPEVETFDPPTRKPYHRTKCEVKSHNPTAILDFLQSLSSAIRSADLENPTL